MLMKMDSVVLLLPALTGGGREVSPSYSSMKYCQNPQTNPPSVKGPVQTSSLLLQGS